MSDELNLSRPEKWDETENEYALVRRAGDLPAERWPDERINAVQRMYGDKATSLAELATFLHVAQRHRLDPALNEIYLIQTKQGPKVYAGRDGYIQAASRYEGYNGHQSGVVYTDDRFTVRIHGEDVEIQHEFAPNQDRGKIHGAYCVAYGKGNKPTFVYREFEKCKNMSSNAWKFHPDDMIENRAIAAALRRQVPLGGLLIEGEHVDDETHLEDRIGKTTDQNLDDLEAELGIRDEEEVDDDDVQEAEVVQEEPNEPQGRRVQAEDVGALREKFGEFCDRYDIEPAMVRAWALHSDAIPDDPDEWTADDLLVALQAMRASEGKDFLAEYARYLIGRDDDIGMKDRMEFEADLGAQPNRRELRQIVKRLKEREG